MADATTTATTEVPAKAGEAGFPPFKTETFPSQLFWLAVTFVFLFVVLWRVTGPRIQATIATRRNRINDDLANAQASRGDAETAQAAYHSALAAARTRAQALAEANRKAITGEVDAARADADAKAHADIVKAEARIAQSRDAARVHVANAARDAAIGIVARLTGETVGADEAAEAVRTATGS